MRKTFNIMLLCLSVATLLALSNCDEELSAEEKSQQAFLNKLNGTWSVNDVDLDGKNVTGAFPALKLTFNKKTITATNPVGNIWPASSTFTLEKVGDLYDLIRNDEATVEVMTLTETDLTLKMFFATAPGGRSQSVAGGYSFELTKD